MRIKTIYIDDEKNERETYEWYFNNLNGIKDKFELITMYTPTTSEIYDEISNYKPDLFLVDYDLSIPNENGQVAPYTGVSVALELKRRFPNVPNVMFTKINYIYEDIKIPDQILSAIDDLIFKRFLFEKRDKSEELNVNAINDLYELANGYKKLREKNPKNLDDLLVLLEDPCNKANYEDLKAADSYKVAKTDLIGFIAISAKWIRKTILEYPGILYDSFHAATFLGISEKQFLESDFQKVFQEAKYTGIFAPYKGLWWKTKLQDIAIERFKEIEETSVPLFKIFPTLWEKSNKVILEKSTCVYSGKKPVGYVCYIKKEPVMAKYSLFYRPDSRPFVMDDARVSFTAILEKEVNPEFLDPMGLEIYYRLLKGNEDDRE